MSKFLLNSIKRIGVKLYSPKYLIITNSVTGIISMSIGDSVQQYIEFKTENQLKQQNSDQKEFKLDKRRNVHMMFAGVYFGLFGHLWYTFLDKRFPGRNKKSVAKKLLSEMAMGPPFIAGLYLIIGRLRGSSFGNCWTDLRSNIVLICAVEWIVYIPLQLLNFSLLAPKYRYLYVATISLGYDVFLSYLMHKNERQRALKQLKEEDGINSSDDKLNEVI